MTRGRYEKDIKWLIGQFEKAINKQAKKHPSLLDLLRGLDSIESSVGIHNLYKKMKVQMEKT